MSASMFRIDEAWRFKTLRDILENPPEPMPPWVFSGLVSENSNTQISSQPHGMKSYTWLQAAIEGALGRPIWGHFPVVKCQRTLFLETEDPGWMVDQRVTSIANGLGITAGDVSDVGCCTVGILGPFDLMHAENQIRKKLDEYKPSMCVLSTLQGLLGGRDWKEQKEMAPVNALLVRIGQQHCPMVVITHSPQDKKQKRAAGTITQAANFPTILHYQKCMTEDGTFSRVYLDSKMGINEKFRLKLVNTIPNKIRFVWSKDTDTEALRHYVLEHPEDSAMEIAEQFGVSDRYVRTVKQSARKSSRFSSGTVPEGSRNKKRNMYEDFRIGSQDDD